jgi:hypothetical protein
MLWVVANTPIFKLRDITNVALKSSGRLRNVSVNCRFDFKQIVFNVQFCVFVIYVVKKN